jgi:hypothetical protein
MTALAASLCVPNIVFPFGPACLSQPKALDASEGYHYQHLCKQNGYRWQEGSILEGLSLREMWRWLIHRTFFYDVSTVY